MGCYQRTAFPFYNRHLNDQPLIKEEMKLRLIREMAVIEWKSSSLITGFLHEVAFSLSHLFSFPSFPKLIIIRKVMMGNEERKRKRKGETRMKFQDNFLPM